MIFKRMKYYYSSKQPSCIKKHKEEKWLQANLSGLQTYKSMWFWKEEWVWIHGWDPKCIKSFSGKGKRGQQVDLLQI